MAAAVLDGIAMAAPRFRHLSEDRLFLINQLTKHDRLLRAERGNLVVDGGEAKRKKIVFMNNYQF